ncbi:MAG: hypothetical protein EXS08_03565 [Planctomycetes bacterium]|nr:hypothetical protein [Planctomycetota bacterium]
MLLSSLTLCLVALSQDPRPDARLALGPLTLEVYVSRTAHVFHLVDQLSRWDDACHGQYREHLSLSAGDEAALARYAAVRAKRRWGQGLEQTFYVAAGVEQAAKAGEKAKQVTRAELDVILPVLERFAARADELLESKRGVLEHAFDGLDRTRLTKAADDLARFTGVRKLVVPVFPLASPAPGGGGMDGGRLRWELSDERVSSSVLLHECTHGFFQQREEELRALVERTPGLSMTLLGEGFAYAMAPGLYSDGEGDNLARNVGQDLAQQPSWKEGSYEWQRAYGLALRPLLAEALQAHTELEAFLPRARDAFLVLRELLVSRENRGPPKLAIAGPAGALVRERLLDSKFHLWISWFDHTVEHYAKYLPELGPGDLLVLTLALDDSQSIPAAFAHLSPLAPDELQRRLRAGDSIEEERAEPGRFRVVLLAAPTRKALDELARRSALVHD